jgi:hypothetical protein
MACGMPALRKGEARQLHPEAEDVMAESSKIRRGMNQPNYSDQTVHGDADGIRAARRLVFAIFVTYIAVVLISVAW